MIEEGRYRNIARSLRICPLCSMKVIEDEYHFLLVCPIYRELRTKLLPKYFCRWPTRNKFIKSLNEEQNSILKKLAKFVYLANEKRTFILHSVADLSTLS